MPVAGVYLIGDSCSGQKIPQGQGIHNCGEHTHAVTHHSIHTRLRQRGPRGKDFLRLKRRPIQYRHRQHFLYDDKMLEDGRFNALARGATESLATRLSRSRDNCLFAVG